VSSTNPSGTAVELDDVQGIVRFGYKHHREACFVLLRVKDAAAARGWLAQAPVGRAVTADPPPQTALQVAFTADGMRALGVAQDLVDGFAEEFVSGMAGDEDRVRRLGDLGANHPSAWEWGLGEGMPHVLLLLYALPGLLDGWRRAIAAEYKMGFEELACLSAADMQGVEPFGFVDGLSQPEVDWRRSRPVEDRDRLDYGNLTCLGEFLLGYPNEYGLYTDRPLLDPERDPDAMLPRAEDQPDQADLGRNGSYLVMRQLSQNVQGFWQYVHREAGGDPALARGWAEAMVGRAMDGTALVDPDRGVNGFTYESDPEGLRCPLGAHIRRANPRNADLPPGGRGLLSRLKRILGFDAEARALDLVASTRFHRLLRRGREYGARLTLEQALTDAPITGESGLHFICLAANIGRQFEFVQNAWIVGTKFSGLQNEGDPLLGHRQPGPDGQPTDRFSMPRRDGPDQHLCGLPQFVTVRGGAYFFLPGIRALRYLATAN
jgi:deferrochelatase/peroxidase EfeB